MLVLLWQIKSLPLKGFDEGFDGLCISRIKNTIDLIAAPLTHICNLSFSQGVFPDKLKTARSFPSSNVMTLPCSLTTGLFLFSPVFPRSLKNSFTSDFLHFLKNLTFLVTISMASDHIILQLWLSSNL